MYEPLLSPEKKHAEVGFYEEASKTTQRPKSFHQSLTDRELKKIDDEVQSELDEARRWSFLMYKDFQNPLNPTAKELLHKCTQTLNEIDVLKNDLLHFYQAEKIQRLLTLLFEVLGILQKQLRMLYRIVESDGDPEKLEKLQAKYQDLGEFRLNIQNPSDICWKVLSNCLDYLIKNLLLDLHTTMNHLSKKKSNNASNETKINEIQILSGKIKIVTEYLPLAASFDKNDIFALEDDHPYLTELREFIEIKTLGPAEKIKKSFKKFIKSIHVGMSALSRTSDSNNQFTKKLTVSFGAMYYFFMPNQAQKQTNLFYSQPIEKTAWEAWNFLEDEFILNMMKITLPSIKYARKVYINKMFEPVKLDSIKNALESQTLNTLSTLTSDTEPKDVPEEVTTLNLKTNNPIEITIKGLNKIPILLLSDRSISIKKYSELDIAPKKKNGDARSSQIVGEKHIENQAVRNETKPGLFNGLVRCLSPLCCFSVEDTEEENSYFDGIIVHFHGGGFVSMSSGSHQSYTRQWAKKLKKPVFSVDYRLAPENPYPAALDDCWQAYNWIINYSEQVVGVKPGKIILAGDSAGGNLALGVAILAIKNGIRVPDGLLLAYPALRLEPRAYSPSLMLALEDQLVPYSLLRLCLQAYIPNGADPTRDPLLSPIHLSNELLERLPPIRMMVGENDPLHDECWRFVDKLRKLNKDIFLTVYKDMCHGFLGYDVPMGMPECKICIEDSVGMISDLLNTPSKSQSQLKSSHVVMEKESQLM